jgi:putative chitinase
MALGGAMENGWPECDLSDCDYATVPGTPLRLPFRKGHPFIILQAFLRDLNEFIEPLMNSRGATDEGSWTENNSVYTSNHKGATAFDYNWADHPMGNADAGWNGSVLIQGNQVPAVRELLRFYTYKGIQLVWWGNDWNSPKDSMHFQMGYNTVNNPAIVQEFIDRFIRPDGFSTFRRGSDAPQTPVVDAATILARATGVSYAKAQEILPTFRDGAILADCKTVPRLAMFAAQTGHESANFEATEEYEDGDESQERWKYKGRTWIQLTWRSAYEGFGRWCFERGLVSDPMVFVNNPRSLADLRWAGLGAAYYWTTTRRETRKYPTLNEASDARDVLVATQIINGGTNGLTDRQNRYNRAIALGDELLQILGDDDELANPEIERMIREVHGALFNKIPSQSIYATPGEGPRWQLHELIKNGDAMSHQRDVEDQARQGNLDELARVVRTAQGQGVNREKWAIERAQRVIAEIEASNPEILQKYLALKGTA